MGWKQEPLPINNPKVCSHLGLMFATLTISRHPEGHEWECVCGKIFVVVSNGGRDKRLVPKVI